MPLPLFESFPLPFRTTNPCRSTRRHLSLLAGDDLSTVDRRRVERHLIGCPACRLEARSHAQALEVLHVSAAASPAISAGSPSVWPALERQIRRSRHEPAPSFARLGLLAASVFVLGLGTLAVSTLTRPAAEPAELRVEASPPRRPALPIETVSASSTASTLVATKPLATKAGDHASAEPSRAAGSRGLDPQRSY